MCLDFFINASGIFEMEEILRMEQIEANVLPMGVIGLIPLVLLGGIKWKESRRRILQAQYWAVILAGRWMVTSLHFI